MLAVDWECEFYPLGVEEKAWRTAASSLTVEPVAGYRHPESLLRGGMHPKLVGTSGQRVKLNAASPF